MTLLNRAAILFMGAAMLLPLHPAHAQQQQIDPQAPLPVDPRVTVGSLENGLRYYIRTNERPENRAELRLVVNAGSILEDEEQRGLAHFAEHMAFNGTRNFERQELVEYLESIGMRFGPDLNAYTSFDETVYMLTVPTDSQEVVATAFQILEDWATGVTFDPEEVDKERGVVIEEWRGRRGAQARILDQQIPVLLMGSRYAERLPIGLRETLESFPHEVLTRFYHRWYRPDLMAIVAVGDFDPDEIEALIVRHFGHVSAPATAADRPLHPVPEHEETLFSIVTDPEAPVTRIEVLHKQAARRTATIADFRRSLVEDAFNGMLNQRLNELTQKPDAPFLGAFSGQTAFVRPTDVYVLAAVVADGGVERGLEAILTEAERVARHGFAATEFERWKLNHLRALERAHAERERTNSGVYASAYASHFLSGTPIPGIAFEYEMAQLLLPGIALPEVERLAREWIVEENRVVLVSAPEKEGATPPGEPELRRVLAAVAASEIEPYEDAAPEEALIAAVPAPADIVEETWHEAVDVHEWRLANGVRVLLKSTDFRDDEIVMRAFAPGGLSLASDSELVSATFATEVVSASGAGAFSRVDLEKALAGKAAAATPFIGELEQGLFGNASPSDVETLFQLLHLYFTAPRLDPDAVASFVERVRAILANRSTNPNAAFSDTLQVTLAQHHPRSRPPTSSMMDELDPERAHAFYRDRFSDASDFTFVFVGNLDLDVLRPLAQSYLGSLPSTGRGDGWRDTGIRPPEGVVEKVVRQGLEPRSLTRLVFTGPAVYGLEESYMINSLASVLRIRLREVLREDLGGTYGVQVSGSVSSRPEERYTMSIGFGAAPERLEELVEVLFAEIERLKEEGPREEDLVRVRETQRRERETSLRQNGYWLGQIAAYEREGLGLAEILGFERRMEALTAQAIREAARDFLRTDRYVRVTLYPAGEEG